MIMKKVLFIMAVSAMAAGCADNSIPKAQLPELDLSNPLLAAWDTPHETPPFSEIKLADYEPAFDAAIACSRAEIDAIVNNPKKPTFGNTIVALERQGELLNRIAGLFFNLLEADTSDEMQEIAQRVQPKLTELSNDISLNPELFARVKQVYEHPGRLRKEDRKLLEDTYQSFARSGAALSDADKELYRKYTSELSGLTLRFGQNALAATNAFTLNITDPKVVAELPAFVREGMAAEAKAYAEANIVSHSDGDLNKVKLLVPDASDVTAISLDGVYNSVTCAYKAEGVGYVFVSRSYGYSNEPMVIYYVIDDNGAIVTMTADELILFKEYFTSYQLDESSYKAGFTGLTGDSFTGDEALISGATVSSDAIRVATEDAFAAFAAVNENGGEIG